MISLDKTGYPRLNEDKVNLAIFSPSNSDTGRGNDFHDPRTGRFTWAPPGNRVAKGAGLLKNLSTPTRKLLFDRAKMSGSNIIAARVVNGQLHVVLLRDGKRVDSFAVDPVKEIQGKQQETPAPNPIEGKPVDQLTDEQRDSIFQVARNVDLQGEDLDRELKSRLGEGITPEVIEKAKVDVLDERIRLLIAYLDLRFRQTIKGEPVSDSEFKIKIGRGMLKKTVAGLDPEHIRLITQRLGGLGWTPEDIKEHWIKGLPKRFEGKPLGV